MGTSYFHQLKSLLLQGSDLLIPNLCIHCDSRIERPYKYICCECRRNLSIIPKATCEKCGYYFDFNDPAFTLNSCPQCSEEGFVFNQNRSVLCYDKLTENLIHNYKYNEMTGIAAVLTELIVFWLEKHRPFNNIDAVVPVPLHSVRKRERGYNQSESIAAKTASHFGWTYKPNLVKRIKYTKSQTILIGDERKGNVSKAFSVDKNTPINDLDILIVDDVFTTGATVNAISKALKSKGAASVFVLTVARAGLNLK